MESYDSSPTPKWKLVRDQAQPTFSDAVRPSKDRLDANDEPRQARNLTTEDSFKHCESHPAPKVITNQNTFVPNQSPAAVNPSAVTSGKPSELNLENRLGQSADIPAGGEIFQVSQKHIHDMCIYSS